mmetsp:Transcript_35828/g.52542  ORF Transcript_35828/g.52542 Transcript_35828/m.52542 type:complete len:190 (-) Transcript_35828:21-590(-)
MMKQKWRRLDDDDDDNDEPQQQKKQCKIDGTNTTNSFLNTEEEGQRTRQHFISSFRSLLLFLLSLHHVHAMDNAMTNTLGDQTEYPALLSNQIEATSATPETERVKSGKSGTSLDDILTSLQHRIEEDLTKVETDAKNWVLHDQQEKQQKEAPPKTKKRHHRKNEKQQSAKKSKFKNKKRSAQNGNEKN